MSFLNDLTGNPVVQILASESEVPYLNRVVLFLGVLAVVQGSHSNAWAIGRFGHYMIRAFGAVGLALPLLLGQMPSDVIKGLDDYAYLVVGAMVVDKIPYHKVFPRSVDDVLDAVINACYAIMKANALVMGYIAFDAATGDSIAAPMAGAYLAVNGHRLLERGVSALTDKIKGDADVRLAIFGGFIYYGVTSGVLGGLSLDSQVARALLALYRISMDYKITNKAYDRVEGLFNETWDKVFPGTSTRGRSPGRSPMKMKRR